ncbi:VOC family protein [Streptomyces sp. NPDC087212]|uniref:VOC family protein n=1 Tax=Streptomyces sp. NPDC087212 TaxID=3365766 RepID=UPI0038025ECA
MLTTHFIDGAPNWIDVGATDLDSATSFYGGLFGWTFQSAGPDAGGYGFFQLNGRTVAGGMQTDGQQSPPTWTVYFQSPDADATARATAQAHGTVVVPPMDVMAQGRMALLADEAGVPFGIWQPGERKGLDAANEPGALGWVELYTADVAAAAAFYRSALGLETSAVTFPGGTYTCVNPADAGEETMFGGIVPLAADPTETGAHWLPYFEVTDTDVVVSDARNLGGTVRMSATDIPGVGRIAKLADPFGARFAVIRSEQREG